MSATLALIIGLNFEICQSLPIGEEFLIFDFYLHSLAIAYFVAKMDSAWFGGVLDSAQ